MNADRRLWSAPRLLTLAAVLGIAATLLTAAAREPANDFHFAGIGDRTGGHHPGVYERIWREVGLLKPDFAINVGDTIEGYIQDPTKIEGETNRQWDEIFTVLRPYDSIPQYFTAGNHDIWNDVSERIYRERTGAKVDYWFKYQQAAFIVLDNSRQNELQGAQYAFLEEALKANADAEPTFIFFHKPFWLGFVAAQNREHRFHKLCAANGVDWVITGHGHTLVHEKFDGVSYLEIGSSGGSIGTNPDGTPMYKFENGKFFHFITGRVKGSKVSLTVKEIQGGGGQGRMFDLENWRGSSPLFTNIDDPTTGEAMLLSMRFQSPRDGAVVPRGMVPVVAAARARPDNVRLTIDGQAVTPDAGPFVAVLFDTRDLNSKELMDMIQVNGQEAARLSPDRSILTWETVIVPLSRELWTRRTPGEVTLIAGTATDGTGQNLPENNDDYFVRDLLVYDGNSYVGAADFPAGQEARLGDTSEQDRTTRTWALGEARQPRNLAMLLHGWDTTGLPAGEHTLELRFGGRVETIKVRLE